VTVVGIVGDVHAETLEQDAPLTAYRPISQAPFADVTLLVRTRQAPEAAAAAVRRAVWELDKNLIYECSSRFSSPRSQGESVLPRTWGRERLSAFARCSKVDIVPSKSRKTVNIVHLLVIVTAILAGRAPASVAETGQRTDPIHVLHLCFFLRLVVTAAIVLLRRKAIGFTLRRR
jgi:hypothetical protein